MPAVLLTLATAPASVLIANASAAEGNASTPLTTQPPEPTTTTALAPPTTEPPFTVSTLDPADPSVNPAVPIHRDPNVTG